MSKRLQVLLEETELDEIRRAAERKDMTVSEWVRAALRRAREGEPTGSREAKLRLIRRASQFAFPTADIDEMLSDIERGVLAES